MTQGRHHKPFFHQVFHCQPNVSLHNKVKAMNLNRWICCLFVVIVVFVMAWKENVMAIVFCVLGKDLRYKRDIQSLVLLLCQLVSTCLAIRLSRSSITGLLLLSFSIGLFTFAVVAVVVYCCCVFPCCVTNKTIHKKYNRSLTIGKQKTRQKLKKTQQQKQKHNNNNNKTTTTKQKTKTKTKQGTVHRYTKGSCM